MKIPKTDQQDGGLPLSTSDVFAFVGVSRIIGDPTGKLMQAEVADRIQKLVNVLRNTVGVMDALKSMDRLPGMTEREKMAIRVCARSIQDALDEAMPEWDAVSKAIHDANAESMRAAQDSD
ncbi:MAG: hypothetical protein ACNA8L_14045 [Luteolibacter sp.]